jgi:hypothetical protein
VPEDTDIVVRERMRSRRAVVLVVDVSGSMRGEKVRIAAATVAALSADLAGRPAGRGRVLVRRRAAQAAGHAVAAARLLDQLLRDPGARAHQRAVRLTVAQAELARSAARRRSAVLLSDAVHNAGPDPRLVAPPLPRAARAAADRRRARRGRWAPTWPAWAAAASPRWPPTATWPRAQPRAGG